MVAVGIGRGVSVGGIGVDVAVGIAALVCAARVHAIDMAVDCRSATLNVGVSTVFEPQALMRKLTTKIIKSGRFIYPLSIYEILATGTPSSGQSGASRSPLQRRHRDDVTGGARETHHPVREEYTPGQDGGRQGDTGMGSYIIIKILMDGDPIFIKSHRQLVRKGQTEIPDKLCSTDISNICEVTLWNCLQ
jgi:hypothetical protein